MGIIYSAKKLFFFPMPILFLLNGCAISNSSNTSFGSIKLEPAETIKLISPFEGRLDSIAKENELFLLAPDFPPGQYVDYQVGHPVYGIMPGLAVDKERQTTNLNKLDESAFAKIAPADSLTQSTRKHKSTIFQARWALHSSGLPAFNPETPIWRHYDVFAPNLGKLIRTSYNSIRNRSSENFTLPSLELNILVRARSKKELDESEFRELIRGNLLELVVKDVESSTEETIPPSDIVYAISEAALWGLGHNAKFQETYHVTPNPNRFDTWAPNDLNLISKTVSFRIPRSRIGYGSMKIGNSYPVKPKELSLPKNLHDKNLLRFAKYWSFKSKTGYFSLYDKAFIVTVIKAALKINPNIGRDYRNGSFGDYKSFLDLIDQVKSNMASHFAKDDNFKSDPIFGLLLREQLNLDGMRYVANILANEVSKANKTLLARYYSNLLARCTYICTSSLFGDSRMSIVKRLLNRYEEYGMRSQVVKWKRTEFYNDIASVGTKVWDVVSNYQKWERKPDRRTPLEQSWIVNELRKSVYYSSPFLNAFEEEPILKLHKTMNQFPRHVLAFSGKFGPYFISIDSNTSVKAQQSSNAWGQTRHLGEIGDTWNYHKRILGAAYDGAQSIVTNFSGANQRQDAKLFISAINNAQSIERSMGHKLFLEAKIINDELNSLSNTIDEFLVARQSGQLFPSDDARVLTVKPIDKNEWVEVDSHLLTYHHEFEYKTKLRRHGFFSFLRDSSVENLTQRGVYEGDLACNGQIFFRNPNERSIMELYLGSDHPFIRAAEQLINYSFKVDVYVEPEEETNKDDIVILIINLPEDERYISLDVGLKPEEYQWIYQNKEMIKDGKLRLTSGLHWPGLDCKLILN